MKKNWKIALIAGLVLVAGIGGGLLFQKYCVIVGGSIQLRNAVQLTMSKNPLEELQTLTELTGLTQLDLRGAELTAEEYDRIQAALPNCRIIWTVPFQGSSYPSDTRSLSISTLTEQDLEMLCYFTELETVDALQCRDYDVLVRLKAMRPEWDIRYQVEVGGLLWPQDTVQLTAQNATAQELEAALAYLPQLELADVSGCTEYEQLLQLQEQYPQCTIRYSVPVKGKAWPGDTETMRLFNADGQALLKALPYLPKLNSVIFNGKTPDNALIKDMMELRPDVTFIWSFDLLGVKVSSQDASIDLSGIRMDNVDAVEDALQYFYQLEKVDMSGCGISNEEMDAFNRRHPDVQIVWTVQMGHISVRTDITAFAPAVQYKIKLNNEMCQNLRYCTELICLDLGHQQDVTDGSFMETMTKMQYLLLGHTGIRDLSFCANMPDLVYLELFLTWVRDISPLLNCKKLEDLNVGYAEWTDITMLPQMPQLKHLWASGWYVDQQEQQWLHEALPNTEMYFLPGSSTAGGWRELPNYYKMRDLLGLPYLVG